MEVGQSECQVPQTLPKVMVFQQAQDWGTKISGVKEGKMVGLRGHLFGIGLNAFFLSRAHFESRDFSGETNNTDAGLRW